MKHLFWFALVPVLAVPAVVEGQSLAEIARKEAARRQAIAQPGKVYTNADLAADQTVRPPSTPATTSSAPGTAAPSPEAAGADNPPDGTSDAVPPEKSQAYWTDRMASARSALERSRIFADALQSRINALTADFVNRDDPAQRAQLELERQRATAELERVKKEIGEQTKAIADIEEEARKAGVPPGWLR